MGVMYSISSSLSLSIIIIIIRGIERKLISTFNFGNSSFPFARANLHSQSSFVWRNYFVRFSFNIAPDDDFIESDKNTYADIELTLT